MPVPLVFPEPMTGLSFDVSGRYLVSSGGKHVQVLHNVTGYKANISDLEEKYKSASGPGMKERIKSQLSQTR